MGSMNPPASHRVRTVMRSGFNTEEHDHVHTLGMHRHGMPELYIPLPDTACISLEDTRTFDDIISMHLSTELTVGSIIEVTGTDARIHEYTVAPLSRITPLPAVAEQGWEASMWVIDIDVTGCRCNLRRPN